jgi:hypothetical protein
MAIFDIDDVTNAVSDAIDGIGDAGDLIGGILKTVSPMIGAIPGVGTAFAVAIYVAGAVAAKDQITDAVIGAASAAIPPGVPRICFDGAVAITKDVADGRSVVSSTMAACRQAAEKAGGAPAVEAFDAGVAVLEGGRIDQRAIEQGRQFALTSGGSAAAASFDVGVSVAEGQNAPQVLLEVARGYVGDVGGAEALAAFDTGVALGYGKTLQEAGFKGLHTFVRGNNGVEKLLSFVEEVGRAKTLGMGLQQALESDLADDFFRAVGSGIDAGKIERTLRPYLDAIRSNLAIIQVPAGELAKQWHVEEAIVREAQALLRQGDGGIDERMLAELKLHHVDVSFDFSERDVTSHEATAATGRAIIASGAKWKGRLLSDICKGSSFTITHDHFDGLTGQSQRLRQTYEITDNWLRGFEIAIGLCEGSSTDGAAQRRVGAALIGTTADGFVAGQEVQFNRTNPFGVVIKQSASVDATALALARPPGMKDSLSPTATVTQMAQVGASHSLKRSSSSVKAPALSLKLNR